VQRALTRARAVFMMGSMNNARAW